MIIDNNFCRYGISFFKTCLPFLSSFLVNLSSNLLVYETDVSLCDLARNVVDPFPFHFQSLPSIKIKRDHDPFHSGIFPDINKRKIQKATQYQFNYNKKFNFQYIFCHLPITYSIAFKYC